MRLIFKVHYSVKEYIIDLTLLLEKEKGIFSLTDF